MASATKRTDSIREKKKGKQGAKRKAALRSKGSTKSAAELFGEEQK